MKVSVMSKKRCSPLDSSDQMILQQIRMYVINLKMNKKYQQIGICCHCKILYEAGNNTMIQALDGYDLNSTLSRAATFKEVPDSNFDE